MKMICDLSAVFVVLMCVYTLNVYAGCPAGFDLNSFAKAPPSKDSNKTDEEILKETIR